VAALEAAALAAVASHHQTDPMSRSLPLATLRARLLGELRRRATVARSTSPAAASIDAALADLVRRGRLAREGDGVRDAARSPGMPPELAAAMDRLEAALDVPAPPPLAEAAVAAGCPPEGLRALEAAGRVVRPEADLAWSAAVYRGLAARALAMAERGELTPAAFRDATGTSRRYVLAILEDLGRRGILARTPTGHVPGPRAPRAGAVVARGSEPPR
jgi:selenocysteine-specific elongation factor